ncbi:MAG: FAD-binding protein [Spirochaetota bacterium]
MKSRIKETLPVIYILLTFKGRINRITYWYASLLMLSNFYVFYKSSFFLFGVWGTVPFYPLLLWGILAVSSKRLHDSGKSGYWFFAILFPILGAFWLFYLLACKRGDKDSNQYGDAQGSELDYYKNDRGKQIPHLKTGEVLINDVTGLNPILVKEVFQPNTQQELIEKIEHTEGAVSLGGGRFSMGGQTTSDRSLHIDMRKLNRIVAFSQEEKQITVEAGTRWCDIQEYIDPHNLSVKIMQTYANFTVGGSLSVNVHGRYMGLGPMILSVVSFTILLADGSVITASRSKNSEVFCAAIGGYNAIGIFLQVTLMLTDNIAVARSSEKMSIGSYCQYFNYSVGNNAKVIFHNADVYPPHYKRVRAVNWEFTLKKPNVKTRLMPLRDSYPLHRYFFWDFSESPFGKWRREYIIDPILFFSKRIHWKNYEAGYDVAELEPFSRKRTTYVLQEYFTPLKYFEAFTKEMGEILNRHKVNVINISIRHATSDKESYLTWAKEDVFAYVLYYKQRVGDADKVSVAVWTRELIDLVLKYEGCFYLPYQAHATQEQFEKAFPRHKELFAVKRKFDPNYRFRNVIWDTYYKQRDVQQITDKSEFRQVFASTKYSDALYLFLQNVFRVYQEDVFFTHIKEISQKHQHDRDIYLELLQKTKEIKPFLADIRYGLPSLYKQKKEMLTQTLQLLNAQGIKELPNYAEIGSTGRYISVLKKYVKIKQNIYLVHDKPGSNAPVDILERGQIPKLGKFVDMGYYEAIREEQIPNESLDLVTCYIGLHHIPLDKLDTFIASFVDKIKPGKYFILREHDVKDSAMHTFVSLIHSVFNAGLSEAIEVEEKELKQFRPVAEWVAMLARYGLKECGERLLQKNDPSDNTLLIFQKESSK